MSGEKELAPCPFCGEKVAADIDVDGACRIGCTTFEGCFAHLEDAGWYKTEVAAIEAWNARATPPGFEMVPEGTIDAICRLVSQYQVGMDCGEQGHLDGIEELIEFVAHRSTQKEAPNAQEP